MARGNLNKAILIGNLGSEPEINYNLSGKPVTRFSIATTETWKDESGQINENTEWHKIVVFGKAAEICKEYLKKGRLVYVEGRIQNRKFEGKDGEKKSNTVIVAQNIKFLGSKKEENLPIDDE